MGENLHILGISSGHDGTAALVQDGRIVAAIAEERLSRKKNHLGFPYRAIEECLRIAHARPSDISTVVVPFREYLRAHAFFTNAVLGKDGSRLDVGNELSLVGVARELLAQLREGKSVPLSLHSSSEKNASFSNSAYLNVLREMGFSPESLKSVDHHHAHAASAYYTSGWDSCLVITIDGSGDGLSATASIGTAGRLVRLQSTPAKYSPGVFYSAVTKYLGFKRHHHEGKTTGLAAFGDPDNHYEVMKPCLAVVDEGTHFVSRFGRSPGPIAVARLAGRLAQGRFFRNLATNALLDYFEHELRGASKQDIAAAAQKRLEDCVVSHVQCMLQVTGLTKIALAGGVFANVRLNQRILEIPGVEAVYIHPNMGDGGTAVGGALSVWAEELLSRGLIPQNSALDNVYLGPEYSNDDICQTLESFGLSPKYHPNVEAAIAESLAKHKIVGRFNGRMEYGPRALGNRSILASPTDRTINDWLNKRLRRTEFMPFAPSILEEAATYYYLDAERAMRPGLFMTVTLDVTKLGQETAPAVCHVDQTARPHIVRRQDNPSYHRVIEEYRAITGLPIIVNTSFNEHEHPIVCSPSDAIRSYLSGSVDVLAIGNFVVERSA